MFDMKGHEALTAQAKEAEWRPVPEYEGLYEISENGEIRSLPRDVDRGRQGIMRTKLKRLCPSMSPNGYWMITLSKGGVKTTFTVHSLVATVFIGPRPDGKQVCHKNGIRTDNRSSNLRYDTPQGNNADKHKHGTAQVGENAPTVKLTERQVLAIRKRLSEGARQRDVAKEFSVSKSLIWAINTRRVWSHV
ncbi:MAG: HNH endonuclease [Mameliella sp.]|nr:HNH endonuclease [Mameliella sp.]